MYQSGIYYIINSKICQGVFMSKSPAMKLTWGTTKEVAIKNLKKHLDTTLRDLDSGREEFLFEIRDYCNNLIRKEWSKKK